MFPCRPECGQYLPARSGKISKPCLILTQKTAGAVTAAAKKQYRRILRELPDFEKGDRFLMNIVSCAMLAAFILCMPQRPDIKTLTDYVRAR